MNNETQALVRLSGQFCPEMRAKWRSTHINAGMDITAGMLIQIKTRFCCNANITLS